MDNGERFVMETNVLTAANYIRDVRVTGFRAPVAGEKAISASALSVPANAPYTIKKIEWYKGASLLPDGAVFEPGQKYFAMIYLEAKSGSIFDMSSNGAFGFDTFTLNGGAISLDMYYSGALSTGQFKMETNLFTVMNPPVIDTISISGFQTPVAGESPVGISDLTVPAGCGCDVYLVDWYAVTGVVGKKMTGSPVFEEGKKYFADIYVVVDDDYYSFDQYPLFLINDGSVQVEPQESVLENPQHYKIETVFLTAAPANEICKISPKCF